MRRVAPPSRDRVGLTVVLLDQAYPQVRRMLTQAGTGFGLRFCCFAHGMLPDMPLRASSTARCKPQCSPAGPGEASVPVQCKIC